MINLFLFIIGLIVIAITAKLWLKESKKTEIYGFSYIGSRKLQEDSLGAFKKSDREFIVILADGMGGMMKGEEASSRVVDFVLDGFMELKGADIGDLLLTLIKGANEKVYDYNQRLVRGRGTGTTLTAIIVKNKKLYWISVGDSRVYLLRDEKLTRLSIDHTYQQLLLSQFYNNYISQEEFYKRFRKRNQLTSFIGDKEIREIDRNVREFSLRKGDKLLLCSDGLYNTLTDDEIKQVLLLYEGKEQQEKMLQKLKMKDVVNQDNASMALVEIY